MNTHYTRGIAPLAILLIIAIFVGGLGGGYAIVKNKETRNQQKIDQLEEKVADIEGKIGKEEEKVIEKEEKKEEQKPKPKPVIVAPKITSISPTSGNIDQTITVTGTGFTTTDNTVQFAHMKIDNVVSKNGKTITFNPKNATYELPDCAKSTTNPCLIAPVRPLEAGDVVSISIKNKNGISNPINYTLTSTLHVLSPNGGEVFSKGSVMNIQWNVDPTIERVSLSLERKSNIPPCSPTPTSSCPAVVPFYDGHIIANDIAAHSGNYSWKIPSMVNLGDYYILIAERGGSSRDRSDSTIVIVESSAPIISSINPGSGKTGTMARIYGFNLSKVAHIHFGPGIVKQFTAADSVIEFTIPQWHYLECFDSQPRCLVVIQPVKPDEYPVLVSNNVSDSNSLTFKVIE
jgi:hypothetical protein